VPPFRPPRAVRREAQRALDWRKDLPPSRRAMTPVGVRRAVQLANGQPVTFEPEDVAERINTSPAGEYVRAVGGTDGVVVIPRGGGGSGRVGF